MRHSAFITLGWLLLLPTLASGQTLKTFRSAGTDIGVYYYPEHWPESQWERDLDRIAELGFEFVHYAEFAWTRMEPAEGAYDFAWLDKAIGLAADRGLKVILCTPSPCVPAWLSAKHPEVLAMDEYGRRVKHTGSRVTASLASPIYQKHIRAMVAEMGKRYGQDDRIWGWQIGNEPHLQTTYDFSPAAEAAFRQWVKEKYGDLATMNHAWGGEFWSFTHTDFDQVRIPNASVTGVNPHALLDFQTYTGQEVARDLRRQIDVLRPLVDDSQWITTNFAYYKFLPTVDPFFSREDLDFSSHTMYLTSGWLNDAGDELAHRLGSGLELSFSEELAESTHGFTGIMELQPGQINWGKINPVPLPGAVRMWAWHAFGLGDEFICSYRFRQPLFGGEQTHHGIMMTDGVTVSRGGQEFVQALNELNEVERHLDAKATSDYVEDTRTAFLFSNRNLQSVQNHPHHADWDTWQHVYTYYEALKRTGAKVTFVREEDTWSPKDYPFMVVPAYELASRQLLAKLQAYVQAGGHLVVSTRTAVKDSLGHLWEAKLQQPLWELIGAEVEIYDHLPASLPGRVQAGVESYPWHTWGTLLRPYEGTEVWASFADQFYKGKAAVTHRSLGKGSVTYVGTWSDSKQLEYDMVRRLMGAKSGQQLMDLPPYVFAEFREGVWVAVNYTADTVELPAPAGATWLHGSATLVPGGVAVWAD